MSDKNIRLAFARLGAFLHVYDEKLCVRHSVARHTKYCMVDWKAVKLFATKWRGPALNILSCDRYGSSLARFSVAGKKPTAFGVSPASSIVSLMSIVASPEYGSRSSNASIN